MLRARLAPAKIDAAPATNGGTSWTHGFLPETSLEAMSPGPFLSIRNASVAYDARDGAWIIS